ncbi:hypothetical protein Tco_0619307, partial [Tanacetum coccineum]
MAQQKVSTDNEKVSTDRPIVSTDGSKVSTDRQKDSTDDQNEGTDEQAKGTDDHTQEGRATQTTQPPTSTIFGDDETIAQVLLNMSQAKAVSREKEKGVEFKDIEETDRPRPTSTRSLLTLKPLPKIDPKDKGKKKIEEEDESESESDGIPKLEDLEEERNILAEEEATNDALIRNYDDIKARIEADRLLAEKLQEEEREQFTIEERAKFLHDTIAAQRKFLAQQRSEAIQNRPPTKNQLRNQMMTYLKHAGNFKHSDFKTKKFKEIQALYEKIKRPDEDFISIGSAEDERLIKKINEKKEIDSSKKWKVDKEEDKEKKMDIIFIYRANGNSGLQLISWSTIHIFDRQDSIHLYDLIRDQFSEVTLDGFELILWGDLKIMMESSTEGNEQSDFWSGQQDWKIVTWSDDLLQRMLDLGLEVERESSVALDLIRHKNWQTIKMAYVVMSVDYVVTYTFVHSEARSWSIPSEDPYEEAARQFLEEAPRSPEYVPDPIELENHVPVYILEPDHLEDLVPAEDEAPTPPLPPLFLSPHIRPPHTRVAMRQMRAAAPSTYHTLLPSGTPPLLPIPLHAPSTSRRADIPEADTLPQKRLLLTTTRPGCEVRESSPAAAARQPG